MKKLLVYLKDYKKQSVLGPLFKLLEASFELFVPLVVAAIIDRGIAQGNTRLIWILSGVLVGLGVVGLVCSVTAQYYAAKASVGFAGKLRSALFAHVQSMSFTALDTQGTSALITRMSSDVNQVQAGLNLTLRLLLRSPFVVFGAMVMAFTIDTASALIFVVAILLLCAVVFGIMLVSIPLYKKVQQKLERVLCITRENLTGARVVRAFGIEEQEGVAFESANHSLAAMQRAVGRISGLMNPLTYLLINGAIIALIYTGAIQVHTGLLSQGMVIALYNYMSQILVELIKMANLIISITKSIASAKRISQVFDVPTQPDLQSEPTAVAGEGDVVFEHVSLTYSGARQDSLSDISFCAHRGTSIGVIGGTGSGKTSLVNLIAGFYQATSGQVRVLGANVNSYPQDTLRAQVGMVPQKAVLFSGTIRENMLWGNKDATDEQIMRAIETAQASQVIKSKPEGLDFVLEQGGKNLSGGQRQRLCIARALVKEPRILILDDSASALDYQTDAALRGALRESCKDTCLFIVSQRTSSIAYADLILVLEDGNLVGCGPTKACLTPARCIGKFTCPSLQRRQSK